MYYWKLSENLIKGELSNTLLGKVTGWMLFYRRGEDPLLSHFYLRGDFHEDIRGKKIRIVNPFPKDRNETLKREGSYMDGFSTIQEGLAGDITAGIPVNGKVPYASYPYIEWYSKRNGRVFLELDFGQAEILEDMSSFLAPLKKCEEAKQTEEKNRRFLKFLVDLGREANGKRRQENE